MKCSPSTVGLDIGYGNLKVYARSSSGEEHKIILPVGAAPIEQAPKTVNGKPDLCGGEAVLVNAKPWVAGVDPVLLQDFSRQTHDRYPSTDEYLALFYAALVRLGIPRIDCLVTGLPCSQYLGPGRDKLKASIIKRLQGEHYISSTFNATVERVHVIAQPVGSFMALAQADGSLARRKDRLVLVLDVGYYSVDWILMRGQTLRDTSSGSSTLATSTVLEVVTKLIREDYDNMPLSPARVESLYRRGERLLELGQHEVDIMPYIDKASAGISKRVMAEVSTSLRRERDAIDIVMVTGGGAKLYEAAAKAVFPSSRLLLGDEPVLANAFGYHAMAAISAKSKAA